MKHRIDIDCFVEDYIEGNEDYINDTEMTVAEHMIDLAEYSENGWYSYLTDDEIRDFEVGNSKKYTDEISEYLLDHYDYYL